MVKPVNKVKQDEEESIDVCVCMHTIHINIENYGREIYNVAAHKSTWKTLRVFIRYRQNNFHFYVIRSVLLLLLVST